MRFIRFITLPRGCYTFCARNIGDPEEIEYSVDFSAKVRSIVIWEGLRAYIPQAAVRPASPSSR